MDSYGPSFGTDTPIKVKEQDLIGRASFAERLADILKSAEGSEPLVIGLYGSWGSGKTSVINLVENELSRKAGDGETVVSVVRFEPWNCLTVEQLLGQFLRKSEMRSTRMRMGASCVTGCVANCFASVPRCLMPSRTISKPC